MIWLAVVLALAAALTVGFSTSVQHRVAEQAPASVSGARGLLLHLAQRPMWWLGQALGFVALFFHALALGYGPIALVQPIAIMGMVFAPPIRAAMSRRWLPRGEAVAVVATFAGLVAFLLATAPRESDPTSGPGTLALVAVMALVSAGLTGLSGRIAEPTGRAFLLGCAAGLLFGSVAVTLKIAMQALHDDGAVGFLTSPATYAFIVVGIGGITLNQISYRTARISASMPALNIVNVLVALLFGYLVFSETPRHTPLALVIEVLAAATIGWGLLRLARFEDEVAAVGETEGVRAG